jgi:class 3 adenylate cyclase
VHYVARAIDASGVTARPGTKGFIAPEVLLGRPLTPACDVFALGMVLAYAVGIRPFGVGLPEMMAHRVVHEEPDLSGMDPQIRDVVAACLAKEPSERPTPAEILELLADPDLPSQQLAAPLQTVIATCESPRKPVAIAATELARAARLLAEAEQICRALPLDEQAMAPEDRAATIPGPPPPPASSSARARGLDDEYDRALPLAVQRARALVHVATVVARSDPARAEQLLDEALHPSWDERIAGTAGYHHILEALVWHSASEFGMLVARIDPAPARRLVADIEKIPPVVRALHHREFLDDVAPFITKVAEVVADVDVASAEELVWPMGTPAREMALAKVAMVAARTDSTRAGQIALAVTGRPRQTPGQGRWEREAPPPPSMLHDPNQAIYWKVKALTEVAIVAARADLDHSARLSDDAEPFARTIAEQGMLQDTATASAEEAAVEQTDPVQAGQVIGSLPPDAAERAEVAMVAALTDPACAGRIAASSADRYLQALVRAVVAVRTDPANATLGRVGYADRFEYASVGNVTNLATRLCPEAAPWQILVTQRVNAAAEGLVVSRLVGELSLRGFSRPIRTFEVSGLDSVKVTS